MYTPSEEYLKISKQLFDYACATSLHDMSTDVRQYYELSIQMLKNDIERAELVTRIQGLDPSQRISSHPILPYTGNSVTEVPRTSEPTRTETQVPMHAISEIATRSRSREDSDGPDYMESEEDEYIAEELVEQLGFKRPLSRAKRTTMENVMRPVPKRVFASKWEPLEKNRLVALVNGYNDERYPDWDEIAKEFPNRSKAAIRQEYSILKKQNYKPTGN